MLADKVKSRGALACQQEIWDLITRSLYFHRAERVYSSGDLRTEVFLKVLEWLTTGKRGRPVAPEEILNPLAILKLAKNLGYSRARADRATCSFEDWTPQGEEIEEPWEPSTGLIDLWLQFSDKLLWEV